MRLAYFFALSCVCLSLGPMCGLANGQGKSAQVKQIDFNRDVRPILSNNCYFCHGPDENERKGGDAGLRLDVAADAYADLGGRRAIAPGKPDESELLRRILSNDESEHMPPAGKGKKLSAEQVETIRAWIAQGAKFANHWSYEPPVRTPLPVVKNSTWARTLIDAYLLAQIEAEGLSPTPQVDRYTLARRVALDLTGLPPSWDEVEAFVRDPRPDGYERFVDSMLAKPAFGEHWGRTWLDLARYADSAGYADDPERTIWGYRDYVIKALNANRPFDEFTIEQLAGDLLPNPTIEQKLATAMHRNTLTNSEGGTNDEEFRNVAIVDRVNTTFAVWMGTSIGCAQCHTHKYDPITQEDYFRVFAILNNTEDADRNNEAPVMEYFTELQQANRRTTESRLADLNRVFDSPGEKVIAGAQQWIDERSIPLNWTPISPLAAKIGDAATPIAEHRIELPSSLDKSVLRVQLPATVSGATAIRIIPSGEVTLQRVQASLTSPISAAVRGQFVRIELPGKSRILSLAEVRVLAAGANIATEGVATQSSVDYEGEAKRAIDGNTSGDYADNSTTHTRQSDDPWWELNLKTARDLESLEIFNRTGGLEERLEGATLIILDEKRNPVWQQTLAAAPRPSTQVKLVPGRDIELAAAFRGEEAAVVSAAQLISPPDAKEKPKPVPALKTPLLLIPSAAVKPADDEVVTLEITLSTTASQTLSFEIATEAFAPELAKVPAQIAALLLKPASWRSAEDLKTLQSHYVREIAPEFASQRQEFASLTMQLAAIKPSTVPIMRELGAGKRRETKLQFRGNFEDLGQLVKEGVPNALHPHADGNPQTRLDLANWIVSEKNPLTARVTVNRLWEQVFGNGIVRTSEDFGSQGELPSHPELLDALALEFIDSGWDVKAMLRLMVTSSAYRQSSKVTPELAERDPENRLLARGPRFRLAAEMVRDVSLASTGLLSHKMLGPSVKPPQPSSGLSAAFGSGLDWQTSGGEDKYRRGLYTAWRRSSPYPSMMTFDATNREVCTIRRNRTNTPLQALVTLNDPVYVEAAMTLAKQAIAAAPNPQGRATRMLQAALLREIAPREAERLVKLYDEARASLAAKPNAASELIKSAGGAPSGGDADLELAAWTVVGNVVLNLDEFLMKR
jgi:hypothetical protein